MSNEVRQLEPKEMWNFFADLNEVPRASKNEERVIAFMKKFGESLDLDTVVDEVGNVIIRKPASPGMENRKPIVMQSHLDMVHQKNNDTQFDFDSQGIDMVIEDDWVLANGTTLGADNGIGVASIMTLLASKTLAHPPLEALFTIDEETGMTGAMGLEGGLLNGEILLNLDTEDDDELTIGCAGGVDVTAAGDFQFEPLPPNMDVISIAVRGLKGGHSGMDIFLGRGNANKLMNRILWWAAKEFGLRVHSIDGGGLRNAIPRESVAVVCIPSDNVSDFNNWLTQESKTIVAEHQTTDPGLEIVTAASKCENVVKRGFQNTLLPVVYSCANGIFRMSPDIKDLVQTSNNLARVLVKDGKYQIGCLTRSSVNSERDELTNAITANFSLLNDGNPENVATKGRYPGWKPVPESSIVKLMSELYQEMFGEPAHVAACHAGLECGILGTNYPEMEMISFGPNIRGAHSPDEKVQISSVHKYWKYLLETLKRIPEQTAT